MNVSKIDSVAPNVSCQMSKDSGNIYGARFYITLSDGELSSGFGTCEVDFQRYTESKGWTSYVGDGDTYTNPDSYQSYGEHIGHVVSPSGFKKAGYSYRFKVTCSDAVGNSTTVYSNIMSTCTDCDGSGELPSTHTGTFASYGAASGGLTYCGICRQTFDPAGDRWWAVFKCSKCGKTFNSASGDAGCIKQHYKTGSTLKSGTCYVGGDECTKCNR